MVPVSMKSAVLIVAAGVLSSAEASSGQIRVYPILVEEYVHDYAPTGIDQFTGVDLNSTSPLLHRHSIDGPGVQVGHVHRALRADTGPIGGEQKESGAPVVS